MSEHYRCNYPVRGRRRGCGEEGAEPKFTKKLNQTAPKDRQPVWRCKTHWSREPEVGAISGTLIRRTYKGPMLPLGGR